SAFVTHGFEDFHVTEPDCPTQNFSVWLMYGGKAESNTVYCCPGEAGRETRSDFLTVESIQIPLVNDPTFQQFIELLKKEPDTTVRSTVVGRFFSGTKETSERGTFWRGFGHMGCCSLLVIERVESFEPHTRRDLDYTAEAGWYEDEGCKWGSEQNLLRISVDNWDGAGQKGIAEQEKADHGQSWAFTDPQRVAMESLKLLYPSQLPILHNVKKTPARQVFRWRSGKKSVVVVVTRPYWLSFYAASHSVAWVTTMIKEVGCQ
ncbi:MAG TPA: hypothetical protein VMX38_09205, partial [Verrucomicrobiae bacterium]|nr:hypothetical protein [Verrucomicrobiae bacterium]